MCLSKVTAQYAGTSRKVVKVFKVFKPRFDSMFAPTNVLGLKAMHRTFDYELGQWQTSPTYMPIVSDSGTAYQSGFHCFKTLADAEKYCKNAGDYDSGSIILPIKVRRIRARGLETHRKYPAIVAGDIFIDAKLAKRAIKLCEKRNKKYMSEFEGPPLVYDADGRLLRRTKAE